MNRIIRLACALALSLSATACLSEDTSETGSPISCPAIAIECEEGNVPTDVDGDGCALECAPVVCPEIAPDCGVGETPVDADGDGCPLECGAVVCPAIAVECEDGSAPIDADGDGCALECAGQPSTGG